MEAAAAGLLVAAVAGAVAGGGGAGAGGGAVVGVVVGVVVVVVVGWALLGLSGILRVAGRSIMHIVQPCYVMTDNNNNDTVVSRIN